MVEPAVDVEAGLDVLADPVPGVPRPDAHPAWDEILDSPAASDSTFTERVEHWVRFWSGQEGEWFPVYLERMSAYEELVDRVLAREGLPASLRYLPVIESGYSPGAVSRASAVGLWQFMAPTARGFGMAVSPVVDERRDPVKSTAAAARYLGELRERFGSWFLALAAYNGGPNRVERLLRRHAPGAEPSDSLYFVIGPHLPRETRAFVARFFAAVRVARDPEAYGVRAPERLAPFGFDEVTVPDATSLDVVAGAAGVPEEEVVALNPQLVRRVTPRGRPATVRLPEGTGHRFELAYALIPPDERVTVTEHVVARGETLWEIARLYGIRLAELRGANPDVDPRRLRPGRRLLVPLVRGAGS